MNNIQAINRKAILYIAMSLDGYIAKPNDDLSFLSIVEKEGEGYGYYAFEESIDTIIMGRKTYDWLMTQVEVFPHLNKETYIITHRHQNSTNQKLTFYTQNLSELIIKLKQQSGKSIFIDGGAQIVNQLLKDELIDEMIISIIPIILGDGIRLFNSEFPEQRLRLAESTSFETGLVQLHYVKY